VSNPFQSLADGSVCLTSEPGELYTAVAHQGKYRIGLRLSGPPTDERQGPGGRHVDRSNRAPGRQPRLSPVAITPKQRQRHNIGQLRAAARYQWLNSCGVTCGTYERAGRPPVARSPATVAG
jgi:hypothetical protein